VLAGANPSGRSPHGLERLVLSRSKELLLGPGIRELAGIDPCLDSFPPLHGPGPLQPAKISVTLLANSKTRIGPASEGSLAVS